MDHIIEHPFEDAFLPVTSVSSGKGQEVQPDIYCFTIQIVNTVFLGNPDESTDWFLVDAGMPHSSERIISEAEKRFGQNQPPKAIILTHGHFDHVGAIVELIEKWDVPVYAHELELPYLTGKANYPPGDPTVDGGLVSEMSPLFPNHGINLGEHILAIPSNFTIPGLKDWKWIHTPGHTPGHISLFREKDRSLIVGDAFVTVKQESLYKVVMQEVELSGPPKYFTTNWKEAWESVQKIESLHPLVAVTGHGHPVTGKRLSEGLKELSIHFGEIGIPKDGRFVEKI